MYRPFRFCGGFNLRQGKNGRFLSRWGRLPSASFSCRAPWLSVLYLHTTCFVRFEFLLFCVCVVTPLCVAFSYPFRSFVFLLFYACVVLSSPLSIAFLYPFRRLIVVRKLRHLPLEVRFAPISSAWFFRKRHFGRRGAGLERVPFIFLQGMAVVVMQ